jgi:hypothetical protein
MARPTVMVTAFQTIWMPTWRSRSTALRPTCPSTPLQAAAAAA